MIIFRRRRYYITYVERVGYVLSLFRMNIVWKGNFSDGWSIVEFDIIITVTLLQRVIIIKQW